MLRFGPSSDYIKQTLHKTCWVISGHYFSFAAENLFSFVFITFVTQTENELTQAAVTLLVRLVGKMFNKLISETYSVKFSPNNESMDRHIRKHLSNSTLQVHSLGQRATASDGRMLVKLDVEWSGRDPFCYYWKVFLEELSKYTKSFVRDSTQIWGQPISKSANRYTAVLGFLSSASSTQLRITFVREVLTFSHIYA
jgi:hypothetical protein